MADDVKFHPIPYHYDASALQEATLEGESILANYEANYEAMVGAMRKREEAAMAERLGDQAMDFIQSLGDAPLRIDPHRVIETTNADGEKVMFVMREPADLKVRMPMAMTFDLPEFDPMRFVLGQRLGGLVVRDPIARIITVTSMPMPQVPGVEAMLADGWVWTGLDFVRDDVVKGRWPHWHRYSSRISGRRACSGRYVERLPTNRRRKRERAKARRRERTIAARRE